MSKINTRYLIIGNSTAAIACVEGIRSMDSEGEITLVSDEKEHTYSRPLISYLLAGDIEKDRMYYRPDDFYEVNKILALLGTKVVKIKPGSNTVFTDDGNEIHFEKCLIATGGKPFVPPVENSDAEGVFTFLSWEDADAVKSHIEKNQVKQAVVVGAGLIGMKTVEALLALGLKVHVVELAGFALSTMLDETAARFVHERLEERGVELHFNTTVSKIDLRKDSVCGVKLENDTKIPCEMLIFAIGVRPNIALVKDAGINTDRGIIVDESMQTNHPDIYAAGDVTQGYDVLLGEKRPIAIFPNAYRQGKTAGINMAGGDAVYTGGMSMNSVSVCGLPTISVGIINPDDDESEEIVRLDREQKTYKKIILRDDRVIGAVFVNDVDRSGIITGLIKSEVDISGIRDVLLTDGFGLLMLPREYRKYVVSGVGIEV